MMAALVNRLGPQGFPSEARRWSVFPVQGSHVPSLSDTEPKSPVLCAAAQHQAVLLFNVHSLLSLKNVFNRVSFMHMVQN